MSYKRIKFYDASTLITFIKDNSEKLLSNKILGIYSVSSEMWYGSRIYTTDEPLIIEFESFAVQIDNYCHSELTLTIVDRDSFLNGKLTSNVYRNYDIQSDPQPFKKIEFSNKVENRFICGAEVGCFSAEYDVDVDGTVRLSGGDYFGYQSIGRKCCTEQIKRIYRKLFPSYAK